MRYLVVIEKTDTGYSAYSPDLPGCASTGTSKESVLANMRQAIQFHIEGLRNDGQPVPPPASQSSYVEVAA